MTVTYILGAPVESLPYRPQTVRSVSFWWWCVRTGRRASQVSFSFRLVGELAWVPEGLEGRGGPDHRLPFPED